MRKTKGLSESLTLEENPTYKRKCGKGFIKCAGIIGFCGFILGISFYAGISYSNYLNNGSL
tara:strand:+ start:1113 stop:1295 length:183 start_codon:yes stop_codon:yes gene_type:complete